MGLELLALQTGMKIVHVPYAASAPPPSALLAGDVQLLYNNVATSLEHVRAGKATALAIGEAEAARRTAGHPDHRRDRAGLRLRRLGRHLSCRPRRPRTSCDR